MALIVTYDIGLQYWGWVKIIITVENTCRLLIGVNATIIIIRYYLPLNKILQIDEEGHKVKFLIIMRWSNCYRLNKRCGITYLVCDRNSSTDSILLILTGT